MRILNLVAGEKWTGAAAVVFDQTAALVETGIEAQFAFVDASPLAQRLEPLGWARPLITHPRTPLNTLRDARRLRETVLREKFDLLHAHTTHDHAVAILASRRTPVRVVRTLHHLRYARRDPVSRLLFRNTRGFAYANREIAARFGEAGPVLSPVVDVEHFRPGPGRRDTRARFGIPEDAFVAGTVGKLAPDRGHEDAIAAASTLPGVTLVHVGHGERMQDLKRRAEVLGADGRNLWLGYQEDALPDLYRSWDVFLFTASGSEQGQRAVLEAMASGLPVVALELPGVRDFVTDEQESFLASDVGGLSRALARLERSPELRGEMGTKARRRAKLFTASLFAEQARKFYEGLLASPL